ncbi:hypothetical protein BKA61DRAFT_352735 [Leptodontidium sp. MPI-SDFR-AT-0119]|nr:hypothetical protein BKA61DRAFT_352735 [Leptodontidium sp. MPI-SDFR-AT-0119]
MTLPNEIKQNIWTMVVVLPEDITPIQIERNSNKFIWSRNQFVRPGAHNISAVPPLMVVNLSFVSKAMYDEVSNTHIFYKCNKFDFRGYREDFKAYIVGLTDARRQAIRSMHVELRLDWVHRRKESMVLIASCKGLQSLELSVDTTREANNFRTLLTSRENKNVHAAVQGLKNLSLVVPTTASITDPGHTNLRASFTAFKNDLAVSMAKPRTGHYNLKLFQQAQESADLHVHGEGRLSEDKKPGIISSRTRSQKAKSISADGIQPPRDDPKYDLNGFLAWCIEKILDSRETGCDDGSAGVEFKVKCQVHSCSYPVANFEGRTETSWEDASVFGPVFRDRVVAFYRSNPEKPGLDAVYNEWLRQIDGEDENPAVRLNQLKALDTVMRKFVKAKEVAAKAAAKAEAAAARAERVKAWQLAEHIADS